MIIFGSILLSLYSISYVQGCAPYFQTVPWQKQVYLLNNSVTCDSTFKNPDPGVTVTGERYCFEVFVGRAFANWVCTQACKNENLMKIDCSKFSWTGQGLDPSAITFQISCSYAGGGVCEGNKYTWAQAESEWYNHCKAGKALGVGPYGKLGNQNDVGNSNNGLTVVVGNQAGGNTKNLNNTISESDNEQQTVRRFHTTINNTIYVIMVPNRQQQQQDQTILPSVAPPVVSNAPYPDSLDPVAPIRPPSIVPVVVATTPIDENTPTPKSDLFVNPSDFVL